MICPHFECASCSLRPSPIERHQNSKKVQQFACKVSIAKLGVHVSYDYMLANLSSETSETWRLVSKLVLMCKVIGNFSYSPQDILYIIVTGLVTLPLKGWIS